MSGQHLRTTAGIVVPLIALALLFTAAFAGAGSVEVGYVESFDGFADGYTLTRDAQRRPVTICMLVYKGDQISVEAPRGQLILRLADNDDPVVLTKDRGLYAVAGGPVPHGFWSSRLAWAADEFNIMDTAEKTRFSTAIRGGRSKFAAPMLRSPQTLAAGARDLTIAWRGGKRVHVTLASSPDGKIVAEGAASDGLWTSPSIDLRSGVYTVTIFESDAHSTTGFVNVIPAERLPQTPPDLNRPEIPKQLRITADAASLASQGDGAFLLEALQRLQPLRHKFHPAETLADALTDGRAPSPP